MTSNSSPKPNLNYGEMDRAFDAVAWCDSFVFPWAEVSGCQVPIATSEVSRFSPDLSLALVQPFSPKPKPANPTQDVRKLQSHSSENPRCSCSIFIYATGHQIPKKYMEEIIPTHLLHTYLFR